MEALLKKPKLHFDVVGSPSHITFDDGKAERRNLPWMNYVGARWDHAEPDVIRMEIGGWMVVIGGQNLGPIFAAIEEQTLLRLRARPEWEHDAERDTDSFAISIRFMKVPNLHVVARIPGQGELPFPD